MATDTETVESLPTQGQPMRSAWEPSDRNGTLAFRLLHAVPVETTRAIDLPFDVRVWSTPLSAPDSPDEGDIEQGATGRGDQLVSPAVNQSRLRAALNMTMSMSPMRNIARLMSPPSRPLGRGQRFVGNIGNLMPYIDSVRVGSGGEWILENSTATEYIQTDDAALGSVTAANTKMRYTIWFPQASESVMEIQGVVSPTAVLLSLYNSKDMPKPDGQKDFHLFDVSDNDASFGTSAALTADFQSMKAANHHRTTLLTEMHTALLSKHEHENYPERVSKLRIRVDSSANPCIGLEGGLGHHVTYMGFSEPRTSPSSPLLKCLGWSSEHRYDNGATVSTVYTTALFNSDSSEVHVNPIEAATPRRAPLQPLVGPLYRIHYDDMAGKTPQVVIGTCTLVHSIAWKLAHKASSSLPLSYVNALTKQSVVDIPQLRQSNLVADFANIDRRPTDPVVHGGGVDGLTELTNAHDCTCAFRVLLDSMVALQSTDYWAVTTRFSKGAMDPATPVTDLYGTFDENTHLRIKSFVRVPGIPPASNSRRMQVLDPSYLHMSVVRISTTDDPTVGWSSSPATQPGGKRQLGDPHVYKELWIEWKAFVFDNEATTKVAYDREPLHQEFFKYAHAVRTERLITIRLVATMLEDTVNFTQISLVHTDGAIDRRTVLRKQAGVRPLTKDEPSTYVAPGPHALWAEYLTNTCPGLLQDLTDAASSPQISPPSLHLTNALRLKLREKLFAWYATASTRATQTKNLHRLFQAMCDSIGVLNLLENDLRLYEKCRADVIAEYRRD
jgi:hypothetical protein